VDAVTRLRAREGVDASNQASFKASLAIAERLATADPGNAGWQRDLAISDGRVAMLLAQLGRREDALDAFRRGRSTIARLRKHSPTNGAVHNVDGGVMAGPVQRLQLS